MLTRYLVFAVTGVLFSYCRNKQDPTPVALLPPITQTGANTFGCVVNGQVFRPQGNDGTANYSVVYDPTFEGGNLDIRAYQLTKNSQPQYLIVGGSQIDKPGVYRLTADTKKLAYYADANQPPTCARYSSDMPATYCRGTLTVTRLDLAAGIVAGTFAFTLAQPGCDTIRVTEGRFDKKL